MPLPAAVVESTFTRFNPKMLHGRSDVQLPGSLGFYANLSLKTAKNRCANPSTSSIAGCGIAVNMSRPVERNQVQNQLKLLMILGPSIPISQTLVSSEAKLFAPTVPP